MVNELHHYVRGLVSEFRRIKSVWLIGSRANGEERQDSDWDLLVFADEETLKGLMSRHEFKQTHIDLFIVYNSLGDFRNPWKLKTGNLKKWGWRKLSKIEGEYESVKGELCNNRPTCNEEEYGELLIFRKRARKIWPNGIRSKKVAIGNHHSKHINRGGE